MRRLPAFAIADRQGQLADHPQPLPLETLLPGDGAWELEIGFGKGRYLLQRALDHPEQRFLGIEVVSKYYRLLQQRARRRGAGNLMVIRAEALYTLSALLPSAFAHTLHVYFPDPWPKSRHHKRRLFDPETVDLVIGVLRPGGTLHFATDHLAYGARVCEILETLPGLQVERHDAPWPDGARTNYEAKFVREGRPILRLSARYEHPAGDARLHPEGKAGILAATARRPDTEDEGTAGV